MQDVMGGTCAIPSCSPVIPWVVNRGCGAWELVVKSRKIQLDLVLYLKGAKDTSDKKDEQKGHWK